MIVKFFGGGRRLSISLRADHGKEIFFLCQIGKPVLIETNQLGIDPILFCFGRKIRC